MDKKKTVWLILASGVFLCVVLVTALIITAPSATQAPQAASITTITAPKAAQTAPVVTETVEQTETAENTNDIPVLPGTEDPDAVQITTASPSEAFPESASGVPENVAAQDNAVQSPVETTIDLNNTGSGSSVKPKSQAGVEAIAKNNQTTAPKTIYTAETTVAKAPVTTASKPAATESKTSKVTATAAPKETEAVKYWVQAASYSTKKGADTARSTLDENRIPAEVFTYKDAKDKLYYRVRVGPYTTKSEAEYWKNRICQIDSFKDSKSYITIN